MTSWESLDTGFPSKTVPNSAEDGVPDLQVPRPFQRKGKLAHTFWAMESLSVGIIKVTLVDFVVQKSEYKLLVRIQKSEFRIPR